MPAVLQSTAKNARTSQSTTTAQISASTPSSAAKGTALDQVACATILRIEISRAVRMTHSYEIEMSVHQSVNEQQRTEVGINRQRILVPGFKQDGQLDQSNTVASFVNIRIEGDGFLYELRHSKTNQSGANDPNNFKPIVGSAALALRAWLNVLLAHKITQGQIFRRILHDEIREPLADGAVRDIIRRRAQLSGQPLGRLSAHSLRSGFVTEAGKQGISIGETMALTGHKSVQTAMGYYHAGEVVKTRAAQLMDIEKPKTRRR